MKIIKNAKKNTIKISKTEWELIGKKTGWIKKARMGDFWVNTLLNNPDLKYKLQSEFDKYLQIQKNIKEHEYQNFNPNIKSEKPYEEKKREREQLQSELQSQWNKVLMVIKENNLNYNYGRGETNPTPEDLIELFNYDRTTPV